MPSKRVPIPYPSKGISENYGFNYQEERTCRDDRNVRTIDPRTGRLRGAQRAGLGVYANATVANGTFKVKAMCAVSNAQTQLAYAQNLTGSERWTNAGKTNGSIVDMRRGLYGSYYAVTSSNHAIIFNEDGEELHRLDIPEVAPSGSDNRVIATCIAVDEYQNVFVGTAGTADTDAADSALYVYRFNEDDTYKLVYTITYDEHVLDVHASKGQIYVLTATAPKGNTSYGGGTPGADAHKSYWRLRVYDDYFPLENAPVENNDKRISKEWQTRPTAAVAPGTYLGGIFYRNDNSVGRISVDDSGSVLLSAASVGSGRQEWGWLGWINPNAEDGAEVVDSLEGSQYMVGGKSENGIGLDAQWAGTTDAASDKRLLWSAGDPLVNAITIAMTTVVPAEGDRLFVYGPSSTGVADCHIELIWGIGTSDAPSGSIVSGSEEAQITITQASNLGAADDAGRLARIVLILAAMDYARAQTNFNTDAPDISIARSSNTSIDFYVLSPDPQSTYTVSSGSNDGYAYAQASAAWATPTSQTAWPAAVPDLRRLTVEVADAGSTMVSNDATSLGVSSGGKFISATSSSAHIRIGQDKTNGAYFPWGRASTVTAYNNKDVLYIGKDASAPAIAFTLGGPTYISAAAAPLFTPDYGSASFTHTPFVLIAGPEVSTKSIHRYDLVTITQTVVNPRSITVVAASGAKLLRITSGSPYVGEVGGTANPFTEAAPYIQMVAGYEKVYITDGHKYWMYDPKATDSDDDGEVSLLVSKTYGTVPPRCRLIEMWRGRLVLARDPADPGRWHMSAIGDVHDWDTFPQVANASQAVSSTSSKAGTVPDIINAVVPWTDDILLFGGDSSIWALSGDPMAGGVMDLVTDETGMSFGRPYCKDPTGALWFFGSTGGLYMMQRGSVPGRVSLGRIERQLREVNLADYYIQLQWNQVDEGVHIFQIPFGAGGTIVNHWFYEAKAEAFHKDKFGVVGADKIQPTAVIRLDGDTADDRTLLMGCEDGRIRRWGKTSAGVIPKSDEKTTSSSLAIDSYILIGPLVNDPTQYAQQVTELDAVLSSSQNGCNFEIFTSDEPDVLGPPAATGSFSAGRNDRRLIRTSGDHVYIRLRNATAGECWAFEGASALVSYGGEVRR